jgi:hypothetical protein
MRKLVIPLAWKQNSMLFYFIQPELHFLNVNFSDSANFHLGNYVEIASAGEFQPSSFP